MIDMVKKFFSKLASDNNRTGRRHSDHDVRVATCALFLEMANIDEQFTRAETRQLLSILKEKFELSEEHANEMIREAEAELQDSVDYWRFARLINENYSTEEKVEIIEILWRIIYTDGKLDKYENYLIHKLSDLLRLTHKQLIDAKLKVVRGS